MSTSFLILTIIYGIYAFAPIVQLIWNFNNYHGDPDKFWEELEPDWFIKLRSKTKHKYTLSEILYDHYTISYCLVVMSIPFILIYLLILHVILK